MKILLTLIVTMMVSSAFANCSFNGPCDTDKECKALDARYSRTSLGHCVLPDQAEKSVGFECESDNTARVNVPQVPAPAVVTPPPAEVKVIHN